MDIGTKTLFSVLTPTWWMQTGRKIAKLIREDLSKGLMQDGQEKLPYRSQEYVKYKRNDMRRFTKDIRTKGTSNIIFGTKTKNVGKGNRLDSLYGKSISSNETRFVNMELTGELKKGLKPIKSDQYSVELSYDPKDTGKILGNERYGRHIVGLNDKNIDIIRKDLINALKDKVSEFNSKRITIKVGK